jgi:hypothetical protein
MQDGSGSSLNSLAKLVGLERHRTYAGRLSLNGMPPPSNAKISKPTQQGLRLLRQYRYLIFLTITPDGRKSGFPPFNFMAVRR